jgi:hypothetical protein
MGVPVAVLDPESLISGSLNELSEILAPARLGSLQGRPPMAGFGHEGITSHTTRA